MPPIGEARFRSAFSFVCDCADAPDLATLREATLGVRRLVPGDLVACNEVDLAEGTVAGAYDPETAVSKADLAVFAALSGQHPLIAYQVATGDPRPRAISDLLTRRSFHRLELYQRFFRRLGAEDQIAFGLPMPRPDVAIGVAINRDRRGFSEAEREVLELVAPELGRAYERVVERQVALAMIGLLDDEGDGRAGVLAIRGTRIVEATPAARRLLARRYRRAGSRSALPAELDIAIRRLRACAGPPRATVTMATPGCVTLRVAMVARRAPAGVELVTVEETGPSPLAPLTPRQREVLDLAIDGFSDAQIAERLGITPRTVQKHLERAYRTLGVSGRTHAARELRRLGRRRLEPCPGTEVHPHPADRGGRPRE